MTWVQLVSEPLNGIKIFLADHLVFTDSIWNNAVLFDSDPGHGLRNAESPDLFLRHEYRHIYLFVQ